MFHSIIFDPVGIIKTLGLLGLIFIIFAETGLFFGFFLPGDSLLFAAGLLASQGYLNITVLVITLPIAAILGDSFGYWFGKKIGPVIFDRPHSWFLNKSHLEKTRAFYEKHGPKTIVLARFVPIIRTFAPILAGVGEMRYRTFLAYNVIGALLWAMGVTLVGYFLGETVPGIENYLVPIIALIIAVSFIPVIMEFRRKSK